MSKFRTRFVMLAAAVWLAPASADDDISFTRDIRPLLSDHCFACHGPDENHREADLRLDVAQSAVESGAIKPGVIAESEIWSRIISDDPDAVMPPPDTHKPLNDNQKSLIRKWIESGAQYQEHWAFVAPEKALVPKNKYSNPVDAFLASRLAKEQMEFNPLADKRTLIRRVTLDLTGLPPTPAEIAAFVADDSPDAYDNLLSNLMSRVSYGEHMGRYWLDLARYADTHGLHLDNERSMWPYRDWVVRAFHQNLTFDKFTRWQLAGDLLPNASRDQQIASGFNRCNVTTSEGGSIAEEWVYRYAVDRTTTTAEVWMGLTAGCAVCHDHKFDPITAVDYYSLYAFFHSAADPAMDGNKIDTPPILKLYSDEDNAKLADLDRQIAAVAVNLQESLANIPYSDPALLDPPPEKEVTETLWFADDFPAGAKREASGGLAPLIDKDAGEVFAGTRALRRKTPGFAQDFFSSGAQDLLVPNNGKVFFHCFIDPDDTPETIMIQFHTGSWKHRAVWGKHEKINFGKPNTTEKVLMGDLPEAGKWVRLELPASKMGLKPSTKIKGYAFSQFGGTVTWDSLGVTAEIDKANDTLWSFEAWKNRWAGKKNKDLPEPVRSIVNNNPADKWSDEDEKKVFNVWVESYYAGIPSEITDLKNETARLKKDKKTINDRIPITFVMADLPKPRESFVMLRGAYDKPGAKVSRNVPAFLPSLPPRPSDSDYSRLDLADWLLSEEHPLTTRVTINRLWQQLFGTGIVETSADFGSQGQPPSHPELLDWLAVEFREQGWDIQKMIRLIMHSHAYRQTSTATKEAIAKDPANRLLARGARIRLDAEVLRDQALYVSGLLSDTVGGKGVNPYQPPNIWEPVGFGNSNTRYYKQSKGEDLYRRSLYTFLKRTAPPPFMSTFDAPNREQSCSRRGRSNTPMQALQLMNDIQHVEAARNLATRALKQDRDDASSRIQWTWEVVTGREPMPAELEIASRMLDGYLKRYASDEDSAKQLISYGESMPDETLAASELAAYTMLANLILNLDETVNKN